MPKKKQITKTEPSWLDGATYEYDITNKKLKVSVPNGGTYKDYQFEGPQQCDLVQCLLDEAGVPGETKAS